MGSWIIRRFWANPSLLPEFNVSRDRPKLFESVFVFHLPSSLQDQQRLTEHSIARRASRPARHSKLGRARPTTKRLATRRSVTPARRTHPASETPPAISPRNLRRGTILAAKLVSRLTGIDIFLPNEVSKEGPTIRSKCEHHRFRPAANV